MTTTTKTTQEQLNAWYQAWVDGDWDGERTPHSFVAEFCNQSDADLDPKRTDDVSDVLGRIADDETKAEMFLDWLKAQKAI